MSLLLSVRSRLVKPALNGMIGTDFDRHSQCEAMTAHYETCILLIEFEEDKFGLRVGLSN